MSSILHQTQSVLDRLGVDASLLRGGVITVRTPVDGSALAHVADMTKPEVDAIVAAARQAFVTWRDVPAPQRGELVRLLGEELRASKSNWVSSSLSRQEKSCPKGWAKYRR